MPSHVDETGRMIGREVRLAGSHRHWSHLLAMYPLRTLTPEKEADRKLIELSLKHWQGFGKTIAGYAFTGSSCMASLLGDGDLALNYLDQLKPYLRPNTMYSEIKLPVMETPLHGAAAIQEMLFQSWGGRLRVFPAVPDLWKEVQFSKFRGDGAFLVSARWEQGATSWVFVEAEAGGTVEVDPQLPLADWVASEGCEVTRMGAGIYRVSCRPGGMVMFWSKGEARPEMRVLPVSRRGPAYRFGLPKEHDKRVR